ncbi:pinensin family lanthipeptide [Roseivirga sp. BDSF3-8]|uniref:pinensin family lanthipeptide n=1 Tax=Roseivirga sp. BDSF3-8 TaxID=3241598 RepID=UPI00353190B9
MKKKIKISNLQVKSFVTDIGATNIHIIKGGGDDTKDYECKRLSYLAYTYCSCI